MTDGVRFGLAAVSATVLLLASLIALADDSDNAPPAPEPTAKESAPPPAPAPPPRAAKVEGLDPLDHELRGGVHVASLPGGRTAELTLDAGLQKHLTKFIDRRPVPWGAAVAIEPSTGRILAYVSHSDADPEAGDLVREASAPAASVFKVVTAAALVDTGVDPNRRVCYSGGSRKLVTAHLSDHPRDGACATLGSALGRSINVIFAKLSDRHLDRATLARYGEAFGFGHSLPFDVQTRRSALDIPKERLERARTAAGFWHSHLSPLHGALLAATVANDGMMPRPGIVERIVAKDGKVTRPYEEKGFRQVIPATTARAVGRMMHRTVTEGTSRRTFHDKRGRPYVPGVEVAGKTGSLSGYNPYKAYSWWVGFAPVDNPQIAFATLVVNQDKWHIKANHVAVEAMRYWFHERPKVLAREAEVAAKAEAEAEADAAAKAKAQPKGAEKASPCDGSDGRLASAE